MFNQEKIYHCGLRSEWATFKFFPCFSNPEIKRKFSLKGATGVDKTRDDALKYISEKEITTSNLLMKKGLWREDNFKNALASYGFLKECLNSSNFNYVYATNEDLSKLKNLDCSGVTIFTNNTSHFDYIHFFITEKKHIICEKPLVVITDGNHRADNSQLKSFEALLDSASSNLVMMDAEHYSSKIPTISLYENIEEMVSKYGKVKKMCLESLEKDDPNFERTKRLLSIGNRTGLLLDMGVHYFGILTNIESDVAEISSAKYAKYSGYDVETYVDVEFNMQGNNLFENGAKGKFLIAKFIDKMRAPLKEDSKKLRLYFKDNVVELDFNRRSLRTTKGRDKGHEWKPESNPLREEYINILNEFHFSIANGKQPRTSFKRSLKTLKTLHRIYEKFPVDDNLRSVY